MWLENKGEELFACGGWQTFQAFLGGAVGSKANFDRIIIFPNTVFIESNETPL